MKELSFEKMEEIGGGGSCGRTIASGVVSIWGIAIALSSTGVLAPLGAAVGVIGLGIVLFGAIKEDACAQ